MSRSRLMRAAALALAGRHDLTFDRLVLRRTGLRPRQAANLALSRLEARLRAPRPRSWPIALQLEPTVRCQLSCPLCPRGRVDGAGADGLMPWPAYARLLDETGPHLLAIAFWQWGEPLLHPRLPEMVAAASRRGILTLLSTNAQADPDACRLGDLFAAGLDLLIVSCDGVTPEAYGGFRAGGDLAAVRRFLPAAARLRDARGGGRPLINVRAIATRGNEGELSGVRALALAAGADLFSIKSVSVYDSGDPGHAALPRDLSLRSFQYRDAASAAAYAAQPNLCLKPWSWPTLRHDGTLLLCECDHALAHPLGNVFTEGSFARVWRGERAARLRREFPRDGRVGLDFCRRCRYKRDDAIRRTDVLRPTAAVTPLPPLTAAGA